MSYNPIKRALASGDFELPDVIYCPECQGEMEIHGELLYCTDNPNACESITIDEFIDNAVQSWEDNYADYLADCGGF